MSEFLRSSDDGTEARPYGRHSACLSCKHGRAQVRVTHRYRDPVEKPADFGEEKGPVRIYHSYSTCMHPDFMVTDHGLFVHPEMSDVVSCELHETRAKGGAA